MKKIVVAFAALMITVAIVATALSGGFARTVAVKVYWNGVEASACPAAAAAELGEGGFRLDCSEPRPWSLYVIYDSRQRHDATIISLDFQQPANWLPVELRQGSMATAVAGNGCASALALGRKTGEPAIPQSIFGAPLPGTYPIALSKPCGELVIEVGSP